MSGQHNALLDDLDPAAIARALQQQPGSHEDIFDVKHTYVPVKETAVLLVSIIGFLLCMKNRTPFSLLLASIAVGVAGYACLKLYRAVNTREVAVTRAELVSLQRRKQAQ